MLLYGVGVALLLAFVWGPVALVASVLLALREVSIAVGTWSCERLTGVTRPGRHKTIKTIGVHIKPI